MVWGAPKLSTKSYLVSTKKNTGRHDSDFILKKDQTWWMICALPDHEKHTPKGGPHNKCFQKHNADKTVTSGVVDSW